MKKYISIILMTLLLGSFYSCSDYDSNPINFYYSYGTIEAIDGDMANGFNILHDKGKYLLVKASAVNPSWYEDGQRVYALYTSDERVEEGVPKDYYITLYDLETITSKPPVLQSEIDADPDKDDEIGRDPIRVDTAWFGGKYLNVIFKYGRNAVPGNNTRHFVNVVADDVGYPNGDGAIVIRMRHNGYEDVPSDMGNNSYFKLYSAVFSFDLTSLLEELGEESVKVILEWADYGDTWTSAPVERSRDMGTFIPYGGNTGIADTSRYYDETSESGACY